MLKYLLFIILYLKASVKIINSKWEKSLNIFIYTKIASTTLGNVVETANNSLKYVRNTEKGIKKCALENLHVMQFVIYSDKLYLQKKKKKKLSVSIYCVFKDDIQINILDLFTLERHLLREH